MSDLWDVFTLGFGGVASEDTPAGERREAGSRIQYAFRADTLLSLRPDGAGLRTLANMRRSLRAAERF